LKNFRNRFKLLIKLDINKKNVNFDLSNMRLSFDPPYPLNIIVDKSSLKHYDNIFKFILLIKQAKYFLKKSDWIIKKHNTKKSNEIEIEISLKTRRNVEKFRNTLSLFQWELFHFVNNFEFFVMGSIITSET